MKAYYTCGIKVCECSSFFFFVFYYRLDLTSQKHNPFNCKYFTPVILDRNLQNVFILFDSFTVFKQKYSKRIKKKSSISLGNWSTYSSMRKKERQQNWFKCWVNTTLSVRNDIDEQRYCYSSLRLSGQYVAEAMT